MGGLTELIPTVVVVGAFGVVLWAILGADRRERRARAKLEEHYTKTRAAVPASEEPSQPKYCDTSSDNPK